MPPSTISGHLKKLKKTELIGLIEQLLARNLEAQNFLYCYFESPHQEISSIEKRVENFLNTATRSRGFIDDENAFADELKYIIIDLVALDSNYSKSFEIMLKIWENDNEVIPICHNGIEITEVYNTEAVDAFHYFANKVNTPTRIKKVIENLLKNEEYDVRRFLSKDENCA